MSPRSPAVVPTSFDLSSTRLFAEGLDVENCLPTEYSGYASAAAATVAATAAV